MAVVACLLDGLLTERSISMCTLQHGQTMRLALINGFGKIPLG